MPSSEAMRSSSSTTGALRSAVWRMPATTLCPARARVRADSRPKPLEALVMTMTWSAVAIR